MRSEKTPIDRCVAAFGGQVTVARICGLKTAALSQWRSRNEGRIPSEYQRVLLLASAKLELDLIPEDLIDYDESKAIAGNAWVK